MKNLSGYNSVAALLFGAATLFPLHSFAASCCGGGSAAALTVPKYARAVADLSFDSEIYDGYWNQERKHVADPAGSDLKQYRINAGVGYRLARDWQASVSIPYVFNDNVYSGVNSQSDGLGDTTVAVTYELLDDNSSWKIYEAKDMIPAVSLGMSLLIPTGISPYDDQKSSFDITGRGFYRLDGTLLVEKVIRPFNASLALAYGKYLDRSVNREYGKYVQPYTKSLGDRASASISTGYTYVLGTAGDSIVGTFSYAYLNEEDASYNGSIDSGSGFDKQSLGAALSYYSNDHNWGVRAGWNHAIKQNGWGKNFPTTDIFSVGVRYVFL
ncbi:MAG: transporter [Desulfuromonadaceae bacterium]|nr:transporter [Desulfuromonadaceae bacterium]MDD2856323.1 transporter [Desulfuromonadaceae bacterium]